MPFSELGRVGGGGALNFYDYYVFVRCEGLPRGRTCNRWLTISDSADLTIYRNSWRTFLISLASTTIDTHPAPLLSAFLNSGDYW